MRKKIIIILLLIISSTGYALAQRQTRSTPQKSKWDRKFPEIKHGDQVYQTGNNWFTLGYGYGYHTNKSVPNYNLSMTLYWRYKGVYFNTGWLYSCPTPKLFMNNPRPMEQLNDIHLGAGLRFEDRWYNFGFFIGPSFASTWVLKEDNPNISQINYLLGAHTEVQCTFKFFYDLGIGTSIFASFNRRYQVVGVQLHFYFSNAFIMEY